MKEYCKCYDNDIGPPLLTNHHSFTNICQTCGKERKSKITHDDSLSGEAVVGLHGRIERGKLEEFAKENKYHCWKDFESANHYLTKKMVLKWLIYKESILNPGQSRRI